MTGAYLHDPAWERRPRHWFVAAVFTPAALILGAGLLGVPGVERPSFVSEATVPQVPTVTVSAPLAIVEPAVLSLPTAAQRLGTVEASPAPTSSWVELVPPVLGGVWGLPYAPAGLDDCAEFDWYRVQWGLPERFNRIAWRESNCRNEDEVRTSCCHGYVQLYVSLHVRNEALALRYEACGVDTFDDINSDTPREKQQHVCAARALYDVAGLSPWATTS